ncbi:MAG: TIGR03905 family TSCPD domain-containing protein [Selenomonas bovis]|nr:TIGR03905 family TSCPD domain-containing protein [Selenomonas bovis]
MTYERRNRGTCSVLTRVELNNDHTIENVEVLGGCNGNLKGIAQLVEGMDIDFVIGRCKGNTCGPRSTSCPDQLAHALEEAYAAEQAGK